MDTTTDKTTVKSTTGVLNDKTGAKSSKRLLAMINGITATVLAVFVVIVGCFTQIPSTTLIISLIASLFTTSLVLLGFSMTEWYSPLIKNMK